jgi:hypothetical protein
LFEKEAALIDALRELKRKAARQDNGGRQVCGRICGRLLAVPGVAGVRAGVVNA